MRPSGRDSFLCMLAVIIPVTTSETLCTCCSNDTLEDGESEKDGLEDGWPAIACPEMSDGNSTAAAMIVSVHLALRSGTRSSCSRMRAIIIPDCCRSVEATTKNV